MVEFALTPADRAYLDTAFTYNPPMGDQEKRYQEIRTVFRTAAETILRTCPPSRERSIALTQLEISMMMANASIAREI